MRRNFFQIHGGHGTGEAPVGVVMSGRGAIMPHAVTKGASICEVSGVVAVAARGYRDA